MATDKNKSTEPLNPNPKPSLDQLFRFTFDGVPVRGQWVRLGNCLDAANEHRSYDPATRIILGQMFTAAAMFADNLKFDGAVALQSSGDGRMVRSLAECRNQQFLRGVVHLDDDIQAPAPQASLRDWLGKSGRLAITLQPDSSTAHSENAPQSYQGLVALDHGDLKTALEHYFDVSEQLPTRIYFGGDGASMTGLLVQKLPHEANANDMQIAQADDA